MSDEPVAPQTVLKTTVKLPEKLRFLELLRAHLVVSGGVELSDERLVSSTLRDLLELCFNNGVALSVNKEEQEEQYAA